MNAALNQDDRMAALLADAMELPEEARAELAHWLSILVRGGVSLEPDSVRAGGASSIRKLFKPAA